MAHRHLFHTLYKIYTVSCFCSFSLATKQNDFIRCFLLRRGQCCTEKRHIFGLAQRRKLSISMYIYKIVQKIAIV